MQTENVQNGQTKANTIDLSQYEQIGTNSQLIQVGRIPFQLKGAIIKVKIVTGQFGEGQVNQKQEGVAFFDGTQYHHYTTVKNISIIPKKKNKQGVVSLNENQNIEKQVEQERPVSDDQEDSFIQPKTTKITKKNQLKTKKNYEKKVSKASLKNRLKFLNQLEKNHEDKKSDKIQNENISAQMVTRNSKHKK